MAQVWLRLAEIEDAEMAGRAAKVAAEEAIEFHCTV
jgi:hypothetical protein